MLSAEAAAGGSLVAGSAPRLCTIKHIEHIECNGHSDVGADEATNDWLVDSRLAASPWNGLTHCPAALAIVTDTSRLGEMTCPALCSVPSLLSLLTASFPTHLAICLLTTNLASTNYLPSLLPQFLIRKHMLNESSITEDCEHSLQCTT